MQEKLIVSKASAQVVADLHENQRLQDVRLVAFLDIMGFKDMVARQFSLIETKLTSLSKFISDTIREDEGYQYLIFSDSIIIYVSAAKTNAFPSLLKKVGRIVEKSISLGLPIKGAIAKGECTVCMDTKPFFFGQPIIDAYTLEESVVLYGVVLHNTVEELAEKELKESGLVYDYKVPLKGGASRHYVLSWFAENRETNMTNLNHIRTTVSDSPRRYLDNTMDSIAYFDHLHGNKD